MKRFVGPFGRVPYLYAISYEDSIDMQVCYPIGIHLIMKWLHNVWMYYLRRWRPSRFDLLLREARQHGYKAGMQFIREEVAAGFKDTLERFKE